MADTNTIPDSQMTASSHYLAYYPYLGRLHETRGERGWCADIDSTDTDYLQVDAGRSFYICAVATQGKGTGGYVTSYKLSLSTDGVNWNVYKEHDEDKVRKMKNSSSIS